MFFKGRKYRNYFTIWGKWSKEVVALIEGNFMSIESLGEEESIYCDFYFFSPGSSPREDESLAWNNLTA